MPPAQIELSAEEQQALIALREALVVHFHRLDRQPLLFDELKHIAELYRLAVGRHIDCATLASAVPVVAKPLAAPMPSSNPEQLEKVPIIAEKYDSGFKRNVDCSFLVEAVAPSWKAIGASKSPEHQDPSPLERVRESFLKMAPWVAAHAEYHATRRDGRARASWNLPPEAKTHPRQFWEKIWNAFDFSTAHYIDLSLPLEEQPPDVHMYLAALGFWSVEPTTQPSLQIRLGYKPPQTRHELGYEARYDEGREFLQNVLQYQHGICLTTTDHQRPEPFPWLDCRLGRFDPLKWEYFEAPDDEGLDLAWHIDYHDFNGDDYLQPIFDGDHFSSYSYKELLLTNVRVPLPRRVLKHHMTLVCAMQDLYSRHHPLQMLGEARTLIRRLHGDEDNDDDLKAAMLYQVISRLAKGNMSFFPLLLDDKLDEDNDSPNSDPKWAKYEPDIPETVLGTLV